VSLETIWDSVAKQAAEVDGVIAAYSPLITPQTDVREFTRNVDTGSGVIAWVRYTGTQPMELGNRERIRHRFNIDLYARSTDPSRPYKLLAVMPEKVIAKWRTNVDLYGTCVQCLFEGSDEPVETLVNEVPFVILPIRVWADEYRNVAYTA
jgi:hypothetical protein